MSKEDLDRFLRLSADMDLISGAVSELNRILKIRGIDLGINIISNCRNCFTIKNGIH